VTWIDPIQVDNWYAGHGGRAGTQYWVNVLAHEGIWLNASGQRDHTEGYPLLNPQPDGDIASGTVNPYSPYTVSAWSKSIILNAFGF